MSDISLQVTQFIRSMMAKAEQLNLQGSIEVESKLGWLMDKRSRSRIYLEAQSETIVDMPHVFFKADMTVDQHARFNQYLNSKVGPQITYKHTKQVIKLM